MLILKLISFILLIIILILITFIMIVMFILKLIVSTMLIMIPIVVALPKLYQSYIRVSFLSGRGDKTDFKTPFTVHHAIFGSYNCFVPVLGNFDAVVANKIRPLSGLGSYDNLKCMG